GVGRQNATIRKSIRLAHGWRLMGRPDVPAEIIRRYIRPAVRAVPRALAARLKSCRIRLPARLTHTALASQWIETAGAVEIDVPRDGMDGHDLAMELLVCLGQALWEAALPGERKAYLNILSREIDSGVSGEIDEDALREKQALFSSRASARSRKRLERYIRASFAGTVAEYIHSLWHDVSIRTGSEHLPAIWLRRRLELLAKWFPPDRGY